MAARGGGTGLERAGFPPRPVHLKLVVVAGARSVPERSGCDGETGADDFRRLRAVCHRCGRGPSASRQPLRDAPHHGRPQKNPVARRAIPVTLAA